jgi:hypothetical protein
MDVWLLGRIAVIAALLFRHPNLSGLIQDNLHSFSENRLARSATDFDVVVTRSQVKLLELVDWTNITIINVKRRVL